MTRQEHKRRILQGLITTLENDLNGVGAAYIYEDSNGRPLSEVEVERAEQAGSELLASLRKMVARGKARR